jgi:hypothetical protein
MNPSRAEIARERRRQIQVRKALETGLESVSTLQPEATEFFLACAEYIVFSMDRLHEQDQVIHDLLCERIPPADRDAHARLAELGERQDKSRVLMDTFRADAQQLKESGYAGLQVFIEGAKKFTAAFNALLAPRKNPFHRHTDQLFTDADWIVVADVSDDSLAAEEQLFMAVRASAPEDIDPEQMTVEHK